jgi:hypothetical protein
MNQREKILLAIVILIFVAMGGFWGIQRLAGSFDARNDEIAKLQREVEEKQSKIRRGKLATARFAEWEKNSLPSDISRAKSQYWVWLEKLADKAGLDLQVKPFNERQQGDVYVQNMFHVTGKAELRKLIPFLHDFYSSGYLHRISSFSAQPIPDKKELDISLAIDALSLKKAPKVKDTDPPPSPLTKTSQQYADSILGRNFFAPGNNAPKFNSVSTQKGNPNRPLSFSVKASDPDKLDQLTYSLESPTLEGAKIDPKSGEVRWTPTKLGDNYEVVVRVTDDGAPPKSTTEKIKIAVVDPPPPVKENPFAKDDPARDAKITGMVGSGEALQVWVTVPRGLGDQPKTLHLNSGDEISVGSFVGVVKSIRTREAEFQLKDGRTVVVRLQEPLVGSEQRTGL